MRVMNATGGRGRGLQGQSATGLVAFAGGWAAMLLLLAVAALAMLSGCATAGPGSASGTGAGSTAAARGNGVLFGGQQPIVGAQVYLYAAGTAGTGSASRSMLAAPGYVVTGADGGFNITGKYTCQAGDQVYVLATGGNAGGGVNTATALMTALGPCSALTPSTFIYVNEVTTVAAVYALAPYMTGPANVGAGSAQSAALAGAFASSHNMVDTTTGVAPARTAVGNGAVPQATVNSLANSVAACVNSASGSSACGSLFQYTTVSSTTPANTVQAVLNVANNPAQNTTQIFNLGSAQAPFQPSLSAAPSSFALPVTFASDVLMYYNDLSRSGVQSAETALTPANVNSTNFGKLRSFAVDGFLFAQPLYVGGLGMPDGVVHDVVFASTAHGTVYAFDADGNSTGNAALWSVSLVPTGEVPPVPSDYYNCGNPSPESTIIGTPVIDRAAGLLYVVSKTKITAGGTFVQRLHALSLLDGSEQKGGPVTITATFAGTGGGSAGGVITFDPLAQNQRSALLLVNGTVWIAYASHCDQGPYHGLVLGYNAASLAQTAIFNNTPNGTEGGIWMSAGGPSADTSGNVYVSAGNGDFDVSQKNYGDGVVRLTAPSSGLNLNVADYFVPSDQASLSQQDNDMGMTQPLLFTDPSSTAVPHLLVATDKTGRVYLLNRDNLGGYDTGHNGPDGKNGDIQDWTLGAPMFGNFAYFNNTLYIGAVGQPVGAWTFTPGNSTSAGTFGASPSSQSTVTMPSGYAVGGVGPTVSANGTANGIVWGATHTGASVLYAFDATNLATMLYNSSQAANSRDYGPQAVKFSSAMIANGKVFVPGQSSIVVYGLLH